jgi:hypothetical protein
MSDSFQNRRKHVRIYRNFILSCRLKGDNQVKYEMSQVNNISRGGVNFSATADFPVGSELMIELKTPFLSDKVDLEGAVLESRDKIPGLVYAVRVQFQNISPQAEDILAKIEQYSAQQQD